MKSNVLRVTDAQVYSETVKIKEDIEDIDTLLNRLEMTKSIVFYISRIFQWYS